MPRLSTITYDDVARTATAQLASGVNPTNQSIKTVLNGSFTTIAPLLKRWKQEHQQPPQQ
ncbi:MAG: DNA-binding protein, partial [Burkholderiaceae bacterium]